MKVIHSKALNGGYATEGDGPNEDEMKALENKDKSASSLRSASKIPSFPRAETTGAETKSLRSTRAFSNSTNKIIALSQANGGENLREIIMKYAAK